MRKKTMKENLSKEKTPVRKVFLAALHRIWQIAHNRSILIGGNAINNLIVTGNRNKIFFGPYKPLRDAYIWPQSIFEQVDPERFVGREWLLKEVDDFLNKNTRGYFILEAAAGLGKTAFLAWLVKKRAYIHHFTEQEPRQEYALKSIAAQLMLAYLDAKEIENLPAAAARPDYLFRLLDQAAKRRDQGEKIVVVVDALDAAIVPPDQSRQNVLGLPTVLPEGVFIIASKRPVPVALYIDMAQTPRRVYQLAAEAQENRDDMRRFLVKAAKWPGVAGALRKHGYTEEQFIDALLEKSGGVWIYARNVVHEIESGQRSPLDLSALPDGMTQYYLHYWRRWRDNHKGDWDNQHLPLLATLAAVQAPMTVGQLIHWAGVRITGKTSSLLNEEWRPFIAVVQSPQERFQFYHATLRDFWEGKVTGASLTTDEEQFVNEVKCATVAACRRIVRDAGAPEEVRRDAALRFMRLRGFQIERMPPDEVFVHLELVAPPYTYLPEDLDYLISTITDVLAYSSLDDRQRARLLVYRAGMRGEQSSASTGACKMSLLSLAREDYQCAEEIVRRLIGGDGQPEDYRMLARILLGRANIALVQSESADAEGDRARAQALGQEAVELLLEAAQVARAHGQQDLLVSIYGQLCCAYIACRQWGDAERSYGEAIEVLDGLRKDKTIPDSLYYSDYAWIVGTASHMHLQHGKSLRGAKALAEYEKAYDLAQEEIKKLTASPVAVDELELAFAHITAGDCQWAISEQKTDEAQELREKACDHWRKASEIAERIGYPLDSLIEQSLFAEPFRRCLKPE